MQRSSASGLIAVLCMLAAQGAGAAEAPAASMSPITDKFAMRVSYYRGSVDTQLRLDADDGTPGTDISAEDTLGMDPEIDQGRMELYLRMGERFRVRTDYMKINRYGDVVLAEDVLFGNETYLAGEQIESTIDFRSLDFTFLYSFFRGEQFEIAAGLGLYLIEAEVFAEAVDRNAREQKSGIAPFVTPALDASWQFARRWSVNARAQFFTLTFDDVDGTLADFHLDVQYRWRPNLAFGLGYSSLDVKAESSDDPQADFPGRYHLKTSGPELFLRASF